MLDLTAIKRLEPLVNRYILHPQD